MCSISELIKTKSKEIHSIINELLEEKEAVAERVSQTDLLLSDLLHTLELNKLSASQISTLSKELKSTLKVRRKYKDRLRYLSSFKLPEQEESLNMADKNINSLIKSDEKRRYHIRITDEIKKEILAEVNSL